MPPPSWWGRMMSSTTQEAGKRCPDKRCCFRHSDAVHHLWSCLACKRWWVYSSTCFFEDIFMEKNVAGILIQHLIENNNILPKGWIHRSLSNILYDKNKLKLLSYLLKQNLFHRFFFRHSNLKTCIFNYHIFKYMFFLQWRRYWRRPHRLLSNSENEQKIFDPFNSKDSKRSSHHKYHISRWKTMTGKN